MFTTLITLLLAQAAPPSVVYLECTDADSKVWNVAINEAQGMVTFHLKGRTPMRVAAVFDPDMVYWQVGRRHPITGFRSTMGVDRTDLRFGTRMADLQGNPGPSRTGQCRLVEAPSNRVF